ncbi:MAG: aspartate kinase [Pirellulales bacterium]|nr:aspartate kinase [Pirellulales bacterium]
MSIVVQKFGGTSVADRGLILAAARKAIRAQLEGNQVVVVVSAMGKNTDRLIQLAHDIHDRPPAREMDMLLATGEQVSVALMAMAIDSLGYQAVSMTGAQLGIVTDDSHTKARIRSISTTRITEALAQGKIVIAAGFQGVNERSEITTLGRGGSDTTAVALAAVLGADRCEIYTDVDGVYTTDPKLLAEARRLSQISYDEMLELASAGAGVMHNRSIEFAKKFSVPIYVRNSLSEAPGTMIVADPESLHRAVCGAALVKDQARITLTGVPDRPGAALTLISAIAAKNVAMDMIVQNVGEDGLADISLTVFRDDLAMALKAVEEAAAELGVLAFNHDDDVSCVSVVGLPMAEQAGVANRMFRAMAEAGINILMISTSHIKISLLVARESAVEALQCVHKAFELEREPAASTLAATARPPRAPGTARPARPSNNGAVIVSKMQGMEGLVIEGITLDESQARATIHGVPNVPGLAADMFDDIASSGINVDVIVQSYSDEGTADLSFTFPRENFDEAIATARRISERFGCKPLSNCPQIALLSVYGIGLRSHTQVAGQMFESLGAAGINVEMINTSEVCISVAVNAKQGAKGLAALEDTFRDVML